MEHQEGSLVRAVAIQRRNRIKAAFAGGIAGLVGTALTTTLTRSAAILWHSFLLEALLCTVAGYMLARRRGGILAGTLLFAVAYVAAIQLRTHGLDLGSMVDVGELRYATATDGPVMSFCMIMACGGAFGSIIEH